MKFTKMHGLGNDYVYVNGFEERVADAPALARAISDRHRGVGSDGLILIMPSERADVRMEMYNADGSRSQMCGNGIRCVAKYAYDRGLVDRKGAAAAAGESELVVAWHAREPASRGATFAAMRVESDAGVHAIAVREGGDGKVDAVSVDMGPAGLAPQSLPATFEGDAIIDQEVDFSGHVRRITCVSMGNPHAVVFVDDLSDVDLLAEGPRIERAAVFPERINAHFAVVESPERIRMMTWERGTGPTQACGTGACAVAVAGVVARGTQRSATVELPGGALHIDWRPDGHVFKTGPAVEVFDGVWPN